MSPHEKQPQESDVIHERTPGEKQAYVDGYAAGINSAVALARIYEGQPAMPDRIKRAGGATADLLRKQIA